MGVFLAEGEARTEQVVAMETTGDLFLDEFSGVENVIGSATAKNHLVGDENDNMLTGGADADKIKGGAGNDTIVGGGTDASDDTELLDGGEGVDTLVVTETHDLSSQTADPKATMGVRGFENLVAAGSVVEALELTGDEGANALTGGPGEDTLTGGEGSDVLNGAGGEDTLIGGMGSDTFIVVKGEGADTIGAADTSDFSGVGGDKIYLKGFSAEEKTKGFVFDPNDAGDETTVSVDGTVVVTVRGAGNIGTSNVMFKDD